VASKPGLWYDLGLPQVHSPCVHQNSRFLSRSNNNSLALGISWTSLPYSVQTGRIEERSSLFPTIGPTHYAHHFRQLTCECLRRQARQCKAGQGTSSVQLPLFNPLPSHPTFSPQSPLANQLLFPLPYYSLTSQMSDQSGPSHSQARLPFETMKPIRARHWPIILSPRSSRVVTLSNPLPPFFVNRQKPRAKFGERKKYQNPSRMSYQFYINFPLPLL
jgi:hypothetical protein